MIIASVEAHPFLGHGFQKNYKGILLQPKFKICTSGS